MAQIFTFTHPSTVAHGSFFTCFLNGLEDMHESQVIEYEKNSSPTTEQDFLVDLTFNNVPALLLTEFAEKIVRPYYSGNLNAAIQDLIRKALAEQDFVLSHVTHVRNPLET